MAFVGIEFGDNGGVSLVNVAWLTPLKRGVYWPPTKGFVKLLQTGEDPPEDGTWKLHKVKRQFFQTGLFFSSLTVFHNLKKAPVRYVLMVVALKEYS